MSLRSKVITEILRECDFLGDLKRRQLYTKAWSVLPEKSFVDTKDRNCRKLLEKININHPGVPSSNTPRRGGRILSYKNVSPRGRGTVFGRGISRFSQPEPFNNLINSQNNRYNNILLIIIIIIIVLCLYKNYQL